MTARTREWLIRGGLSVGLPLALLGSIEVAARMAGIGYDPAFWVPVAGVPALATNDAFGLRFFPRSLVRTPAPEKVFKAKPEGTKRIFVLGESAAMGFPEPALGLAPMLEYVLRDAQPGVKWEVHNAAMTAINSHVIVPIARESAQLSPDVFLILAGNNEAVGPYGPATVFGQTGAPLAVARASSWVQSTRLGQMLARMTRNDAPGEWRGLEMFAENRLAFSDSRLPRMYEAFRQNLSDVVRAGVRARAQVLLMTVPVNLRDCPPFASAAPEPTGVEFHTAHKLLAAGRHDEALKHFRRARDYDLLRFRADSRINDIIRETARREKAVLVDAENSFGIAGNDLFWEHVHFTPEGTFRLASLVAKELGVINTPSFDRVRETFPVTRWDENNLRVQIAGMRRRAPFTAQPENAARIAELQKASSATGVYTEARASFETAVSRRPNDLPLLGRYASMLRDSGNPQASADVLARMIRLLPGRKAWHVSRGAALSDAGLHAAAITEHKAALAIDSEFDLGHFGLGLANARMGRHEDAVRHYTEALRLSPSYAEAAYNMAGSLAALGRTAEMKHQLQNAIAARPDFARAQAALGQLHAKEGRAQDAIRHYQAAVRGEPPLPEVHYDLGVLLAAQGKLDEAIANYEQAAQLRPNFPEALNNLGIALARKGDRAGAVKAFARALEVQPSFEAARANLDRTRRTTAQR